MMKQRILPPAIEAGATVGIVSPSWDGAAIFPHRLERGVAQLRAMGFDVRIGEHALNRSGYVSDSAANRASDIHAMFADPDVQLVLAAIGGDHCNQLLPHLNFDLIRDNPTVFMGYSDITVLNLAIWRQTGLVTFNGPMLLVDFAEFPTMLEYTEASFLRTVTRASAVGRVAESPRWTDEFLDWGEQKDLERARRTQESRGWSRIHGGVAEDTLIGGCLESLEHLRGTPYWPDWEGALLFIETSEEAPGPARVDAVLMDYENMGVFDAIAGLLVARPAGYSEAQRSELREVLRARTADFDIPVLADMDFGHTAPQFILPIGIRARMDGDTGSFELLEPAVSER